MMRSLRPTLFVLLFCSTLSAGEIDFGRDIRPLLSDRCFNCHGPDRDSSDNDLRLDLREHALESAIVPGDPDASELLSRILSDDEDMQMPPVDSGRKPLTKQEIERIRQWIAEGAEYADHWAYQTPVRPELPQVSRKEWPANEFDYFTLAAMEARGLCPGPEADRRTLIRRLSFDLLGLPPTPEEVQEFLADDAPDAYERLVDRLLSSSHFGERMAMFWLDLVRYADTNGYHGDNPRQVDAFRDYVINAFNNNKPFDQFTIEQLAGDLLPDATTEQKVASGYNRMLQTTQEGGAQAKEYVAIYQADRVRNVSSVWLASTMACCQCHDHKFDPFSTRDFYSLGAFFADIKEVPVGVQPPNLLLPTPEEEDQIRKLEQQLAAVKQQTNFEAEYEVWQEQQRELVKDHAQEVIVIAPKSANTGNGANLAVRPDLSVYTGGEDPDTEVYTVRIPLQEPVVTALRLEALRHKNFVNQSLSRGNGNFVLTGIEAVLKTPDGERPLTFASAQADYEQPGFPVTHALDSDPATGWAVDGHRKSEDRMAIFLFEEPVTGGEDAELIVTLRHESIYPRHNIGRFRFSLITSESPSLQGIAGFAPDLVQAFSKNPAKLAAKDRNRIAQGYKELSPQAAQERKQVLDLEAKIANTRRKIRSTLIAESLEKPRMVRVLPRGNWMDDSGQEVLPAIPEKLGSLPKSESRATRRDLANWLVSDENPLTARVFVNRVWKLFFGWGIARSLEDFGYQGDWPTHPELLDEMAVSFRDSGWDVKHLVKQIVMSRTYRQSSQSTAQQRLDDPFNHWLSRQTRYRFDAEFVRDNALAVSGLLVSDVGGPSVKPYQPAGYWQHLNFPIREWQSDSGPSQYRRGMYTFWCRSFLHPSLLAFDATTREECVADRSRSNTPLQALVLLNDPTYVEAARSLAVQLLQQPGTDQERIARAWQLVLQRDPLPRELEVIQQLLAEESRRYTGNAELAAQVLENGQSTVDEAVSPVDVAVWTAVCRALLNLHETITRS